MALLISLIGSFVFMELASWFIHKYIMHGPLWNIHKSHHKHTAGWLELNDVFTLFFSSLAIGFLVAGLNYQHPYFTGVGIGISLYGCVYFILHDVFIHRRIKLFAQSRNFVLSALADAHRNHHKSRERDGSTSFGLLLIDLKYFKKHLRKGRKA
jgi:beta-carotene 3-hydroxylase